MSETFIRGALLIAFVILLMRGQSGRIGLLVAAAVGALFVTAGTFAAQGVAITSDVTSVVSTVGSQ